MKTLVFFDIETSQSAPGVLNVDKPPIIWIYAQAVNMETGEYVDAPFDEKIKFRLDRADNEILKLINYTEKEWADAKPPSLVANMFSAYVDKYAWYEKVNKKGGKFYNAVLAGQNIRNFDLPILFNWYKGLSTHFSKRFYINTWYYPHVDTLSMLQAYDAITGNFSKSNSLNAICKKFDIDFPARHNPRYDIEATIEIWKQIKSIFVTMGDM